MAGPSSISLSGSPASSSRSYLYTAGDERLAKFDLSGATDHETWTVRGLGNEVLRTWEVEDDTWSWQRDNIFRGSKLAAAETDAGAFHFHLDHLGSPRLVTNASGGVKSEHTYYPFGTQATTPTGEQLQFTGHERDDNGDALGQAGNFDYMHARYYLPWFGGFMSVDPIDSAELKAPQSWNKYAYARSNPVALVDPTGEAVVLSGLSQEQQKELLTSLNAFTGNTYGVDETEYLTLEKLRPGSSKTATMLFSSFIASEEVYTVEGRNGSPINFGRAYTDQGKTVLDFKDFTNLKAPANIETATMNIGAVLTHELVHLHNGLSDSQGLAVDSTAGDTVGLVNQIRQERGFLLRGPAYSGSFGLLGRLKINFCDPTTPQKIHFLRFKTFDE